MANNQRRGGNAQGNRGAQGGAAQPQQQPAANQQRQPQGGTRIAISHLSETDTLVRIFAKLTVNNADAVASTPVYFAIGQGSFLTQVRPVESNGEAKLEYKKKPGEKHVTIKVTGKVAGDPTESQVFVFEKPVPVKGAPAEKPAKLPPFAVKTCETFGDDENRWYTTVGVKVLDPTEGQTVTFNRNTIGTEPVAGRSRTVALDANGTAFADFQVELETRFLNVLVSTKDLPATTVRIDRPALNAAIEAWVNYATLVRNPEGHGYLLEVAIEGKVLHDIWRQNRRVSVWMTGAAEQFVRTHDGLFNAVFQVDPELVPDLNDVARFGALLVGTDASCSGSFIVPDWKPAASTLAQHLSREWHSFKHFGAKGVTQRDHSRDVDSSLTAIQNCSIMLLAWGAVLYLVWNVLVPMIPFAGHVSFYWVPLPLWELTWLPVVCYWWQVEDIMHQRRRIYLFHWTFSGFILASCLFWWFLEFTARHDINPSNL